MTGTLNGAQLYTMLSSLGDNLVEGYKDGRKIKRENDRLSALQEEAAKGGGLNLASLGTRLLGVGDLDGAFAAARLAEASEDRRWRRDADTRDFGFRQQEAERAQRNADRGFGFQETEAQRAQSNTDRTFNAGREDEGFNRGVKTRTLDVQAARQGVPDGYERDPSGALKPLAGGPADPRTVNALAMAKRAGETPQSLNPMIALGSDKPPTEDMGKAGGFADRMLTAEQDFRPRESVLTDRWDRFKAQQPIFGNALQSDDRRLAEQAKSNFINAQLRRESGAAINKDEFDRADRQYFPQPGDDARTIAQKRINRRDAIQAMIRSAGPGYQPRSYYDGKGELTPYAPPGQKPEAETKPATFDERFGSGPQPGDVVKGFADIPEGAVFERNGQRYRKFRGRPIPVDAKVSAQ